MEEAIAQEHRHSEEEMFVTNELMVAIALDTSTLVARCVNLSRGVGFTEPQLE
jgi:hypothetical protein